MTNMPQAFYLFTSENCGAESVFFKVQDIHLARILCNLFNQTFPSQDKSNKFLYKSGATVTIEQRILLDEAIHWIEVYHDPDPGVYDPPPSTQMIQFAKFANQAAEWKAFFEPYIHAYKDSEQVETGEINDFSQSTMLEKEWHSCGYILLSMLSQGYYSILEKTLHSSNWFVKMDLELNHHYLWILENIRNLLKHHSALKDFPIAFEPPFEDLFPLTIKDVEWQDMVAPNAERFLSEVQRYVFLKKFQPPVEGSVGWGFLELFKATIQEAVQAAEKYDQEIVAHYKRVFPDHDKSQSSANSENKTQEKKSKRFEVALSFAGEKRKFIEQVAESLATKFGKEKILYDRFHQPELARFDLDTYLQKLYHDESEMIAVFLCKDYEQKEWCGLEFRALRDLVKKKEAKCIMLFRFDDVVIPGIFSIDGCWTIGNHSPIDITDAILKRLEINKAH